MLSDDVYRAKLRSTVNGLKTAAAPFADVAEVEITESADYSRLSMIPRTAGACPVVIMLRSDQQFDIALGAEFYEDCRLDRLELFEPLIQAVTSGNVIQRHYISTATGTEQAVETIVTLPDGSHWHKGHVLTRMANALSGGRALLEDRRFLPYRR